MKCKSPTGKNFESIFLKLILPCVGKKTPINCSGMPLEWLWGGEWAFMIFDRLKTSVQSGFLELKQAEFKLSSWEWDLCRVPAGREGGREGAQEGREQCRHSGSPFSPATSVYMACAHLGKGWSSHLHFISHGPEQWVVWELFRWKAAVSNLLYEARAERQANNNVHISRVWFVFYCNLRTTVKLSETPQFQNKSSTEDIGTELGGLNFTVFIDF